MTAQQPFSSYRTLAARRTAYARVPFSDTPTAAIAVLRDGTWIPGVRVESASYSLTLPALLNAYTTAVTLGQADALVALLLSRPARPEERVYVDQLPGSFRREATDTWVESDLALNALPPPGAACAPVLSASIDGEADGLAAARDIARRAHVPSSNYPVGAVFETADGALVPGVNVEHPDWARILCAERAALGTAQSYALPAPRRLFLTCKTDPEGSPCGACRQLLAELAPEATLWMDRHEEAPERATAPGLLPGSFRGRALLDKA